MVPIRACAATLSAPVTIYKKEEISNVHKNVFTLALNVIRCQNCAPGTKGNGKGPVIIQSAWMKSETHCGEILKKSHSGVLFC